MTLSLCVLTEENIIVVCLSQINNNKYISHKQQHSSAKLPKKLHPGGDSNPRSFVYGANFFSFFCSVKFGRKVQYVNYLHEVSGSIHFRPVDTKRWKIRVAPCRTISCDPKLELIPNCVAWCSTTPRNMIIIICVNM